MFSLELYGPVYGTVMHGHGCTNVHGKVEDENVKKGDTAAELQLGRDPRYSGCISSHMRNAPYD